jgi:hypothetical protein
VAACLSLVGSGSAAQTCARLPLPAQPRAVAAAEDRIWVADASGADLFDVVTCRRVGKRIQMPERARIYPRSGTFQRTRVASDPHGIAFGAGYVWVALYHQSTIVRLDPRRELSSDSPSSCHSRPSRWRPPMVDCGDPGQGGFLADASRRDVLEIDPESGVNQARFRTRGRPQAVAVAAGAAWIATSHPNELVRIGPS